MLSTQQAHLDEDRSLIPINMLVGQLPVPKMGDHYEWDLDFPMCRRNFWEEVIHSTRMRETRDHFVDERLLPHCAADRHDLKIAGLASDEMVGVEAPQLACPYTACHSGDVIHIWIARHRRHRRIDVLREELSAQVLFPERDNFVFVHLDLLSSLPAPRVMTPSATRPECPLSVSLVAARG